MVTFSRLGGSFPTCPSTARRLTTVYFNPSMSAAAVPIAARALRTALKRGGLCSANDRWLNERPPWKLDRANEWLVNEWLMCEAK